MSAKKFNVFKRCKNVVKKMATPGESLSEKAVKGGFWVFSLRITDRLFKLIRTIILARLLSPNDFGVFGIALLVLSILDSFSQAGFQQALIQKKGETKHFLNTAWTVGLIRGFIIAGVVFFLAKPATIFFKAPAAENILRIIGISIILQSLNNIAVLYFQKELQFNKFFKYQFLGTIADVTVAITLAFLLKSVWALVFGLLAGNLVRCIMSYVIEPYRPRFRFNRAQAKELFGFGRWILGSSILMFLLTHGDDIFVGKMLGATMLGFYQMAYRISNMAITEYSGLVSMVAFPAYSKLRENISRLNDAYLKVFQLSAFLAVPIAGGIFILAPEFTRIFLGEKWIPIVPAMQILAVYGMVGAIGITGPLFMAIGKPEIRTKLQFIGLAIMAVLIYPFSKWWGIVGTSLAVTAYVIVAVTIGIFIAFKLIQSSYKKAVKILLIPLLNTSVMVLVIFALKTYVINSTTLGWFILLVGIAILIYLLLSYLSDLFFNYGAKRLIKEVISISQSKNYGGKNN